MLGDGGLSFLPPTKSSERAVVQVICVYKINRLPVIYEIKVVLSAGKNASILVHQSCSTSFQNRIRKVKVSKRSLMVSQSLCEFNAHIL